MICLGLFFGAQHDDKSGRIFMSTCIRNSQGPRYPRPRRDALRQGTFEARRFAWSVMSAYTYICNGALMAIAIPQLSRTPSNGYPRCSPMRSIVVVRWSPALLHSKEVPPLNHLFLVAMTPAPFSMWVTLRQVDLPRTERPWAWPKLPCGRFNQLACLVIYMLLSRLPSQVIPQSLISELCVFQ